MKGERCNCTSISFHTVVLVPGFNCIFSHVICGIMPLTANVTFCFKINLHLDPITKQMITTEHFDNFF